MNRFYNPVLISSTVPAALTAYDLPDLAASLAPRKIFIADITDTGPVASDTLYKYEDYNIVKTAYRNRQADGQLNIVTGDTNGKKYLLLKEWINKK
jgi:hypothetical protein